MQKPSERYKLTSDNKIITFKKPVHDPFKHRSIQVMSHNLLSGIHPRLHMNLGTNELRLERIVLIPD